jgi:hypothetical protein
LHGFCIGFLTNEEFQNKIHNIHFILDGIYFFVNHPTLFSFDKKFTPFIQGLGHQKLDDFRPKPVSPQLTAMHNLHVRVLVRCLAKTSATPDRKKLFATAHTDSGSGKLKAFRIGAISFQHREFE